MGTFRIDNKDPLYKKLIKLPTAYYRLKNNVNGYTIYSHIGIAELGNIHDVKLKKEGNKIILHEGDTPLKLNGKDFVIEQEAIIGKNRDDVITNLESKPIRIFLRSIEGSSDSIITLLVPRSRKTTEMLNFINFNDENDPVLKKIKKETGGLYFTIEDDNIYISDKDGTCLPVCEDGSCYQYQYTKNECDVLTIGEIMDSLTKANDVQPSFTLQKGEKLADDIYEANVVLNGKTIATLPKIGYYMLNDQLVMRNHVTKEKIVIPSDFHFLKVVKGFSGDYKLTFCNAHGNEFFEHKKYDPQYSNVSDEYKFISLSCAKKEHNPNLSELFSHRPPFFITEGPAEPGSPGHYQADVFELTNNKKGRKMATLIDEFGYFNENGQFRRCDYHEGTEYRNYNSSEVNEKYTVTDANSEFYLSDITIHTIPHGLF